MDVDELAKLAREVARAYDVRDRAEGRQPWTVDNYMAGFMGDVGDLSKLVMAKSGYRNADNIDERIGHELSDCLWSILVLADELEVDLGLTFRQNMETLLTRVKSNGQAVSPIDL